MGDVQREVKKAYDDTVNTVKKAGQDTYDVATGKTAIKVDLSPEAIKRTTAQTIAALATAGMSLGNNEAVGNAVPGIERNLMNPGQALAGAGTNITRNLRNTVGGLVQMSKGDFSGADRTLIDAATFGFSGGMSALANPDDVTNVTGADTAINKATKKMKGDAANEAQAADDLALATERQSALNDVAGVISGQIAGRRRSPGRDMTLLGGGRGRTNTLLSIMGG